MFKVNKESLDGREKYRGLSPATFHLPSLSPVSLSSLLMINIHIFPLVPIALETAKLFQGKT